MLGVAPCAPLPASEPRLAGGLESAIAEPLAAVLCTWLAAEPELWLAKPTPPGTGGGSSEATVRPAPTPSAPAIANPDATAPAVTAPLTTVMSVLPISPRTMRLAIKGIKAIMIDSSTLATLITIIWLEPTNACRNDPLNCIGFVICNADINDCRMA